MILVGYQGEICVSRFRRKELAMAEIEMTITGISSTRYLYKNYEEQKLMDNGSIGKNNCKTNSAGRQNYSKD